LTELERIHKATLAGVIALKSAAPRDTGNLVQSIKMRNLPGKIIIYVDVGSGNPQRGKATGEAPYMKYTNESWSNFKPPLRGKKNPNEGWFDNAIIGVATAIASALGGTVK
jgi:hypothetical protein